MAIVNYTEHSIAAKQSLKEMQCAMEVRDYDTALANAYAALVEVRLAITAIRHEQEVSSNIKQQA